MDSNWAEARRQLDQVLETERTHRRARRQQRPPRTLPAYLKHPLKALGRGTRSSLGLLAAFDLLVIGLLGATLFPSIADAAAHQTAPGGHPVTTARAKVQATGSSHFTSNSVQVTIPTA